MTHYSLLMYQMNVIAQYLETVDCASVNLFTLWQITKLNWSEPSFPHDGGDDDDNVAEKM